MRCSPHVCAVFSNFRHERRATYDLRRLLSSQCNKKRPSNRRPQRVRLQTRANRVRSNARPLRRANRRDARSSAGDVRPCEAGRHSQLQRRSLAHGVAAFRRRANSGIERRTRATARTHDQGIARRRHRIAVRRRRRESLLNDDGNLCDCCALGAMATLAHFRRPDASVSDDRVTV